MIQTMGSQKVGPTVTELNPVIDPYLFYVNKKKKVLSEILCKNDTPERRVTLSLQPCAPLGSPCNSQGNHPSRFRTSSHRHLGYVRQERNLLFICVWGLKTHLEQRVAPAPASHDPRG